MSAWKWFLISPDTHSHTQPSRLRLVHYSCCGNLNLLALTLGGLSQKQYYFNAFFLYLLGKYSCQFKVSHGRCQEVTEFFLGKGERVVETMASLLLPSVFFFMSLVPCSALSPQLPLEEGANVKMLVRNGGKKHRKGFPAVLFGYF